MQLGLLITNRCNAACTHCATDCGPQKADYLPEETLMRVMDEAAALHRDNPARRLEFCISGGEPFLDMVLLERIVRHGTDLGGIVACQTNGYWASNDLKARQILVRLKNAGLKSLGISASRFHEQFIKRSRVERAFAIARALGIETNLKCALTAGDAELERWAMHCPVDSREVFPIHPYLRRGARPQPEFFRAMEGVPQGRCPADVLTLREDGQAYMCCSPGGFNALLRLGDVHTASLQSLQERFHIGGKQQILRRHGPGYFAEAIRQRGEGGRLRASYADVCDLCCHIGSDPVMSGIATDAASEFELEQLRELFEHLQQAAEC